MEIISCPNCGVILDKMPKARRKCPDCKEWIYLKSPFSESQDVRVKVLMTKQQAADTDKKWQEYYEYKSFEGLSIEAWSAKNMREAADELANGSLDEARSRYLEVMGKVKDQKMRNVAHKEFCKCELLIYKKQTETNHVCINRSSNTHLPCHKIDRAEREIVHINKALKELPIPCNEEMCGCFYTHVFAEEIPKKKPWWQRF